MTTKEAFDRVYSRTKPEGGCLVFTGAREKNGYGAIKINGKKRSAHSVVAEYALGACPEGLEIRHLCGRGYAGCVTASHLRYGTRSENMKDAVRHGTVRPPVITGITPVNRKLTDAQIREAWRLKEAGLGRRRVARWMGVQPHLINHLFHRSTRPGRQHAGLV